MDHELLTEEEAAAMFGYTVAHIRRLRLAGYLRYLRSRPVLIVRAHLEECLAEERQRLFKKHQGPPTKAQKDAADREADRKANSAFQRRMLSQGRWRLPK